MLLFKICTHNCTTLTYNRMATHSPDPQETPNLSGMMKSTHQQHQAVCNIGFKIQVCVSCFGTHVCPFLCYPQVHKKHLKRNQLYRLDVALGT